jgi:hypothetical protein
MCHDQTVIGYAVGLYSLDANGDNPNYTISTWYPDMTTVCRDDARDFYVCGTAIPLDISTTPCEANFEGRFGVDSKGAKFVCIPAIGWTAG